MLNISSPTLQDIKPLNWRQVSISPGSWGGNSNLFRWIIKFAASHSQRSRIATSCNCKAQDPPRCSRCGTWNRLLPQDRTETFSFFSRYVSKPPVPDWERLPGLWPSRTSCCKSSSQAGIKTSSLRKTESGSSSFTLLRHHSVQEAQAHCVSP